MFRTEEVKTVAVGHGCGLLSAVERARGDREEGRERRERKWEVVCSMVGVWCIYYLHLAAESISASNE